MSEQNNAEEILSILKNMYQEMVKTKNCKICRFHTSLPAFQGLEVVNMDFCTKKCAIVRFIFPATTLR